jgi:hypothetical protein
MTTLQPGTIVIATGLVDLDGDPLPGGEQPAAALLSEVVLAARAVVPRVVSGLVASGPAIVDALEHRVRLASRGVLATETEAVGWIEACRRAAIPLVVIRSIVDTPDARLGRAAAAVPPGATGPTLRSLLPLLGHPQEWPSLLRLAGRTRRAEGHLTRVLAAVARRLSPTS